MAIFKGTGVAIVTPMHEDGKVNFEKLEEILEDQIANSTDDGTQRELVFRLIEIGRAHV